MTGLGEEVYTPPRADVDAVVEAAARAIDPRAWSGTEQEIHMYCSPRSVESVRNNARTRARAALESLDIPLSDLEGLKAGRLHAVSDDDMQKAFEAAIRVGYELALKGVPLSAAPKTPEAAR